MGRKPARAELIDRPYPPESSTSLSFCRLASLFVFMRPPRHKPHAHGAGAIRRLVCIGQGRYGTEDHLAISCGSSRGLMANQRLTAETIRNGWPGAFAATTLVVACAVIGCS